MSAEQLDELLSSGAIERVPVDMVAARSDLDVAAAHLVSVEARAAHDPVGAFALAYEAYRKAVVAHMRASGYRVKGRGASHYEIGRYARAALGGVGIDEELRAYDDLRRLRNRSAYEAIPVDEADALEAVRYAGAVVAAVRKRIVE